MTTLDEFSINSVGPLADTDEGYYEDVESESVFDQPGEDEDSESRRSRRDEARRLAAQRRKRQLQRIQASRTAAARTPGPTQPRPVAAEVRRTQAAVREVGLEAQVQADALSSAKAEQSRRSGGIENAVAAGIAVGAAQSLFGSSNLFNNPVAQVGLPLAPLIFLRRPKGGPAWKNPQVLTPVAVAGMFLGKELVGSRENREVADVNIRNVPPQVAVGQRFVVNAVATDRRGDIIGDSVPTLNVIGASEDPAGSGIFRVTADATEVSIVASAGSKKVPLIIPVVRTEA
jgi:hypothetical protein